MPDRRATGARARSRPCVLAFLVILAVPCLAQQRGAGAASKSAVMVLTAPSPVAAIACDPSGALYYRTTDGQVGKVTPQGKASVVAKGLAQGAFSRSVLAILPGGDLLTNDAQAGKDSLVRITRSGARSTACVLDGSILSLACGADGTVVVGWWKSGGGLTVSGTPRRLTAADALAGEVSLLDPKAGLQGLYEGGLPLALSVSPKGVIVAGLWGEKGQMKNVPFRPSACSARDDLWRNLADRAMVAEIQRNGSARIVTEAVKAVSSVVALDEQGIVVAGSADTESTFIYVTAADEPRDLELAPRDSVQDAPSLCANDSSLFWANYSGSIFRAELAPLAAAARKERPGSGALFAAIAMKDAAKAAVLLDAGVYLNRRNADGMTPLMAALDAGQLEIASLVMQRDPNLDARDQVGMTALHFALKGGHTDIARSLVERGVSVNMQDANDWTPLTRDVFTDQGRLAPLLIAKGAKVNPPTRDGWTPLVAAIYAGQGAAVRLLVENGADLNVAYSERRFTPLMLAITQPLPEAALLIMGGNANLEAATTQGMTALSLAFAKGQLEIARTLLERGVSVTSRDSDGGTALMYALKAGDAADALLLLKKGAAADEPDTDGVTPLLVALEHGDAATASLLISKGASLGAKCVSNGERAIHYAARGGKKEAIALVLGRGGGANERSLSGVTPLGEATTKEAAEYLLSRGADPTLKASYQFTLLHLAKSADVVDALLARGLDINARTSDGQTPLIASIVARNQPKAVRLIEKGADLSLEDGSGMSALFNAVLYDMPELVDLLLRKGQSLGYRNRNSASAALFAPNAAMLGKLVALGADVHARDNAGAGLLQYTVSRGHAELAAGLLLSGEDVNQRNLQGETPLYFARDPAMAELLLSNGARLYGRDDYGMTALEQARFEPKSDELISFLMQREAAQDGASVSSAAAAWNIELAQDENASLVGSVLLSASLANYRMGRSQSAAPGNAENDAMAFSFLQGAASGGYREASYLLGRMAAENRGGKADAFSQYGYYEEAAQRGMPLAQFQLGALLLAGANDPTGPVRHPERFKTFKNALEWTDDAYVWLDAAASTGHKDAQKLISDFSSVWAGRKIGELERRAAAINGHAAFTVTPAGGAPLTVEVPVIRMYAGDQDLYWGLRHDGKTVRKIGWWLYFEYPRLNREVSFPVTSVVYTQKGERLMATVNTASLPAGSTSAEFHDGGGYKTAGAFTPGAYLVEVFVGPLKIARCSLLIY